MLGNGQTDRQTDTTTTVNLAAHERRGLMMLHDTHLSVYHAHPGLFDLEHS